MTSPSVDLTSGILSVGHEIQSATLAPAGSRLSTRSTPETTSRAGGSASNARYPSIRRYRAGRSRAPAMESSADSTWITRRITP